MPRRAKSLTRALSIVALACVVCGLAGTAITLAYGYSSLAEMLPPPNPSLSWLERTVQTVCIVLMRDGLQDAAGNRGLEIELEVQEGESASQVSEHLMEAGIVENPLLLRCYMRYSGMDMGIEAGRYELDGDMSIMEIAQVLQHAKATGVQLTVLEGWRLEEIAAHLPAEGLAFDGLDFYAASMMRPDGYSFSQQIPEPCSLEGFLFPDTYLLTPRTSAIELVIMMLDNFEQRVGPSMQAGFNEQGLTLYQAVILASIIEREAVLDEERPQIASVFLNRLRIDMHLEADPTVQYALGQQPDGSWWKAPLTLADLQIASPFNTYVNSGLPPRPICNPGISSLRAVAFPAQTPYYFFVAACDGSGRHVFSETYEEHLRNLCP